MDNKLLQVAYEYEGKHEEKNVNELQGFFRTAGFDWDPRGDEGAWCGAFMRACLVHAGFPDPGPDGLRAAFYKGYGVTCEPQPGAIVVSNTHVALLVEGNRIIGGNQGDMVKEGQVEWYFSDPVYRLPVMPEPEPIKDEGWTLADYSDEQIKAEYDRRFPAGEEQAEVAEEDDGLPEGFVSSEALVAEFMKQVITPYNVRETVWDMEANDWRDGMSPLRVLDAKYKLQDRETTLSAVKTVCKRLSDYQYEADTYDCDDYARDFVDDMHSLNIPSGRVKAWSGKHAFNVVAFRQWEEEDAPIQFLFIEPQSPSGKIVNDDLGEGNYDISNALIVI